MKKNINKLKKLIVKNNRESGMSRVSLIVLSALFMLVLYVSYQIMPFYYYYYELQNQMQSLVKIAASNTDKELLEKLEKHIKKMNIPADIEDVVIVRKPDHISMSLEYDEVFYISWKGQDIDLYVFPFIAFAEGDY